MSRSLSLSKGALLATLMLLIAGCSQVAALAPVGGDHLTEVRFAAIDVLVEKNVDVLVAPVCASLADESISCEGTTTDGETITVTAAAEPSDDLEVKVGTTTLYSGTVTDVINDAVRPGS